MDATQVKNATLNWITRTVVGLNLCPFAKRELDNERIKIIVSSASNAEAVLEELLREIEHLDDHPEIETSLLVTPNTLLDFFDYNDFLESANLLLEKFNFEGVFQIASFHPDYQFSDTSFDDAENYTNRSPYPMLHILREESLERAIQQHPDIDSIPIRNIAHMEKLGAEKMRAQLEDCMRNNDTQE